jgi:HSP20 family protein
MKAMMNMEKRPEAVAENRTYITPAVDVAETKDAYVLEAEMPGVDKQGLEVLLEGNELTILGHRNTVAPEGEVVYRESKLADFRRVFELDPAINAAKIDAKVDQGVLTLTLPKSEQVKPRKIVVTD